MSSRFDEWTHKVDCNNCAHYWEDSCDGVPESQKRHCTSFLATRSVVIPNQIKRLQIAFKWLVGAYIVLFIFFIGGIVLCLK